MSFRQKILLFFSGLCLSVLLLLILTFLFSNINKGVLFFSAFIIAILSGVLSSFIYTVKEKDAFVKFLVIISYILFDLFFIYIGPVTLDRSLSSFIYFYSVKNGSIDTDIYREDYFRPYIQRRFDDGVKIGYLTCENGICKPTLKSKITCSILYPIGKISNVMQNYDEFTGFIDNKK